MRNIKEQNDDFEAKLSLVCSYSIHSNEKKRIPYTCTTKFSLVAYLPESLKTSSSGTYSTSSTTYTLFIRIVVAFCEGSIRRKRINRIEEASR